jgi:hypothetical protein
MTSIALISSSANAMTLAHEELKKNPFLVRATAQRNTKRFSLARDGRHSGETV